MPTKNSDTADNVNKAQRIVMMHPEKAVQKEMLSAPESKRDRFILSLQMLGKGLDPVCDVHHLNGMGPVYELKENGRPAWRCIYYTGVEGKIYVLHVTEKSTNGVDRQLIKTVEIRLKALRAALKAEDAR